MIYIYNISLLEFSTSEKIVPSVYSYSLDLINSQVEIRLGRSLDKFLRWTNFARSPLEEIANPR